MMLTLQIYDLDVTYIPGSKLYIPDTLSRAPLPDSEENSIDKEITIHANMLISSLAVSQNKLQLIKQETENDAELKLLIKYYFEGWPSDKKKTDLKARSYWNYRSDIHVIDDLVFKNNSLIIPFSLRKEMLQNIHSSHLGMSRCKNLARNFIFWPNINSQIEQIVENCQLCTRHRPSNPKETLIVTETPSYPWEKIGADLLQFRDKKYLVMIDYYSKYIEICLLNTSSSAKYVITHFKSAFARHGIPLILFTDNGPPFDSLESKNFCLEWDIEHITSSPNYPQSNGQAESAVKIVKNILQKSYEENKDPYLALLHYRCNNKEYMKSPAEMLMSRKLRSNIPILKESLKPKVVRFDENSLNKQKENYKKQYDKNARDLLPLKKGENVMFKKSPNSKFENGIVKDIFTKYPRSYLIQSENGTIYRRNRRHLLLNKSTNNSQSNSQSYSQSNDQSNGHSNVTNTYNKKSILKNSQSLTMSIPLSSPFAKLCIPKPSISSQLLSNAQSSDSQTDTVIKQSVELQSDSIHKVQSSESITTKSMSNSSISDSENYFTVDSSDQELSEDTNLNNSNVNLDNSATRSRCKSSKRKSFIYVTKSGRRVYKPKGYYNPDS